MAADAGGVRGVNENMRRDLYQIGPNNRGTDGDWYWDDCQAYKDGDGSPVIGRSPDVMEIRERTC